MKWKGNGSSQHYRYQYCASFQGHRLWLYSDAHDERYDWERELIFEIKDGETIGVWYDKVMEAILARGRKVSMTIEGTQHGHLNNYVAIPYCAESMHAIQVLADCVKAHKKVNDLETQFFQESFIESPALVPGYAGDPP